LYPRRALESAAFNASVLFDCPERDEVEFRADRPSILIGVDQRLSAAELAFQEPVRRDHLFRAALRRAPAPLRVFRKNFQERLHGMHLAPENFEGLIRDQCIACPIGSCIAKVHP
jgi:hypothetical protein